MKTKACITAALLATSLGASSATISFSDAFTDDASTGISTLNTYTHTIGGGQAATVNGVSFDLLNSTTTPANFTWTVTSSKNQVTDNFFQWVPATGGVTGTETINLLDSFAFAGGAGSTQTYTLSGLNIGQEYDTRLYIRAWAIGGLFPRPIDFVFTNGAEIDNFLLWEDAPTNHGFSNDHNAYYLSYSFTAQATTLSIDASPAGAETGGFHLYALTNQFVPEPSSSALLGLGGLALMLRRKRS